MVARILGYILWGFIAIMVVLTGWDEPLRYRTMSQAEIASEEAPPAPPQSAQRVSMDQWRPLGTALDRLPYQRKPYGVLYNEKSTDQFRMGTPTETQMVPNKTVSGVGQGGLPPR